MLVDTWVGVKKDTHTHVGPGVCSKGGGASYLYVDADPALRGAKGGREAEAAPHPGHE